MIGHVIDGETAPSLYYVASVCERFGLAALGTVPDTRTIFRLHQCLALADQLSIIRDHMRGQQKSLPPELMPLADEVIVYKYRARGEEPPKRLRDSPSKRHAQQLLGG